MPFVKGKSGNPSGREPGSQNRLTKTVKETVLQVFNEIQEDPKVKLLQFAKDYPRDFYNIAAKLIPTEVQAKVEGQITWQEIKTYEAKSEANPGA